MDDTPGVGLSASPNINSVLKPPKPRVPLKDILSVVHDEDNTVARKRRVSFANVNKIKEFSAGAESMVVCHTPAYEEPFSLSSDSSYPSGVDGGTPAKTDMHLNLVPDVFYAEQKENMLVGTVSHPPSLLQLTPGEDMFYPSNFMGKQSLENFSASQSSLSKSRMSGVFFQGDTLCDSPSSSPLDDMDFTSCVDIYQGTARNSTRFSVGMDLTSAMGQSIKSMSYNSSDGMDLTKAAFSLQQVNDQQLSLYPQSSVNFTDGSSPNDSDTLEFTDAVNEPKVVGATTISSNLTGNLLYSANNTKYSESGMDLTKAAFDRQSVGRHSTRYSLNNMDLTEAIGNADYNSRLEFTGVGKEARMSTRYSMNEMDLTEAVTNKNYTRFSTNTMEFTGVIGGEGDCYADSETSMDFTKPIHNVYLSLYEKGSTLPTDKMELTMMVEAGEREKSLYNSMEESGTSTLTTVANDKSLSKGYMVDDKKLSTTSITEDSQILINKTELIPLPKSISCKNENNHLTEKVLPMEKSLENIQKQSVLSLSIEKQSEQMQDLKPNEMSLHLSTICNSPQNDKSASKIAVSENVNNLISNPSNQTCQINLSTEAPVNSGSLTEGESHHCNVLDSISVSSAEGVGGSIQRGGKIESQTTDLEILDKHHTPLSNNNLDLPNDLVLNNLTNKSSKVVGREKSQSELLEEVTDMDLSVLSIDEPSTKEGAFVKMYETLQEKQSPLPQEECLDFQSGALPNDQLLSNPNKNDDEMEISIIENNNGDQDDVENSPNTSCKVQEISNTAPVLKCDGTLQKINEKSIDFEKEMSCSKVSQDDSGVNDITANNSQVLSVNLTSDSINRTLCCKNITLTRGGSRKCNATFSVPQALSESEGGDSVILVSDETSVLESSLLIPCVETKKQSIDSSEIICDVYQDEYSACEPAKGSKRSFEIALQPENDTEESPVKLICLEKVECTFDDDLLMNVTAPSFMMTTLNTQSETMPSFHHSITASKTGSLNQTCQKESAGQTFSENRSLMSRAVEAVEHLGYSGVCEEDNFSLRVNISAEFSVLKNPESHGEVHQVRMDVMETHQKGVNQKRKEKSELVSVNSTLNHSHAYESESVLNDSSISQSKLPIVQHKQSRESEAFNHSQINNHQTTKVSCDRGEGPKSANNKQASSEINFGVQNEKRYSAIHKHIEALRETGKVKNVRDGVFSCDLIPKWIELQFSVEINGNLSNPTYNVIALERDRNVAEYLLQQLKIFTLPRDVFGLMSLLQDSRHTFLAKVARDIKFLCNYHYGKLKGNILTLEVVSTRHHRWICIDVNVKYPQTLNETDIAISEQKIGELKLSRVRQVFNSIDKGSDMLFRFSEALRKLEF